MAETFGVEDRGHFYDPVGALRDVVVNHLMQLLAAAAMEPPAGGDADSFKDAKFAVFRSMAAADPDHYVRGQYEGYRKIDGVAPQLRHRDLRRAAARDRQLALGRGAVLHPHRQAHAGHPDRAAAGLPPPATSAVHPARQPEDPSPASSCSGSTPTPGSGWCSTPSAPTAGADRHRTRHGVRQGGRSRPPPPTRCCCTRRSSATAPTSPARTASRRRWRVVQPLLDKPPRVIRYAPGSWGPPEADELPRRCGGWHRPWLPD